MKPASASKERSPGSGLVGAPAHRRHAISDIARLTSSAPSVPRATGAALVLPTVNGEPVNLHLAEISLAVAPDAHAILVLDGAGWHQSGGRLKLPENVTLMPLPRYAPELNPVENIWELLRANLLSHRV